MRETTFAEWIDRLRQNGVWASRWSSPDLIEQLHRCLTRPIDTIICNLLDLDPAVPVQAMLATRWATEVVAGVRDRKPDRGGPKLAGGAGRPSRSVCRQIAGSDSRHRRAAGSAGKPLSAGAPVVAHPRADGEAGPVWDDAGRAGHCAVRCGGGDGDRQFGAEYCAPMLDLPVGIFDQTTRKSHFLLAPVGTPVEHLLEQAGVSAEQAILSSGTPLHEHALGGDCVMGGGELTIYASPPGRVNPEPCIRCGWCVEACPVRIQPAALLEAAQQGNKATAEEFGLAACVECGICSFVCPSDCRCCRESESLRKAGDDLRCRMLWIVCVGRGSAAQSAHRLHRMTDPHAALFPTHAILAQRDERWRVLFDAPSWGGAADDGGVAALRLAGGDCGRDGRRLDAGGDHAVEADRNRGATSCGIRTPPGWGCFWG